MGRVLAVEGRSKHGLNFLESLVSLRCLVCYTTGKQENQDDESIAMLLVRHAIGVHLPFLKMGNWAAFFEIIAETSYLRKGLLALGFISSIFMSAKINDEFTEKYIQKHKSIK